MEKRAKWEVVSVGMVRLFLFVVLASMLLSHGDAEAAEKVSEGNTYAHTDDNTYTYTLYDDDTAIITEINAANPVVSVPEAVDGHPVTSLGLSSHTARLIPNSVTEIDSLYINSPYIQSFAFAGSRHIGTLTLGEDVTSYGNSIFSGNRIDVMNYNSTDASNSDGGNPLGASGLQADPATVIGHLNIGDNVQQIPGHMFCNVKLVQDELELHVPAIGSYAFESRGIHIGTLTLTDDVKQLGYFVTSYCTIDTFNYNITDAAISDSLNGIFGGGSGSRTTTHIGRLNIGGNVEYIPTMAFEYLELEQDELTLNAARIGDEAFRGTDIHIGTLNIGENVTRFGYCVFAGNTLGTVNYDAASAMGSGTYSVFGPSHGGGSITYAETVNVGEGVESVPKSCFKCMDIGRLNYNAVASSYGGGSYSPMFEDSTIGQVNFGEGVTAIPANMLKESMVGNTSIVIPQSVTSIGAQWATDMTADSLRKLYVYANTKSSSPDYIGLDYPDLYIHRGSGFYDYFTDTDGGAYHEGMTVHLLCDDYMETVEYGESNGVVNGYRSRSCSECGYIFDREYLVLAGCGEGVSSTDGQNYYAPGAEVTVGCTVQEAYVFAHWVDTGTGEEVSADSPYTFTMGDSAVSLFAVGKSLRHTEIAGEEPDPEPDPEPDSEPNPEPATNPTSEQMPNPDSVLAPTPTDISVPESDSKSVTDNDRQVSGNDEDKNTGKSDGKDGDDGGGKPKKTNKPKKANKKSDDEADIGTPIAPDDRDGSTSEGKAVDTVPISEGKPDAHNTNGGGGSGAASGREDSSDDGKSKDDEKNKDDGPKDEKSDGEEDGTAKQDDDADGGDSEDDGTDEENVRPPVIGNGWFLLLLIIVCFCLANLLFFLLSWLTRWKLRGEVLDRDGNPVAGISLKLYEDGEAVQETVTDDRGEYFFRDISRDGQELRVYGKDGRRILTMRVVPKEKDLDDIFRITRKKVAEVEVKRIRRTIFADITV